MIRLLADTGMRRGELLACGSRTSTSTARSPSWLGKGRRERACPFGRKTALAVDRYLRHPPPPPPPRGALAVDPAPGPPQRIGAWPLLPGARGERGRASGRIHPHQLRHTFAHAWLAAGGNGRRPDAPGRLGGAGDMLSRLRRQRPADERARDAHKRLSLGDRL